MESLFSQSWYSVADMKIKLRQHADIHRHVYRGRITYILQDHVSGQFHRFSPEVYQVISLMDGKRTLEQIWELVCEKLGDTMPTQNDVINLVAKLYRANVIQSDRLPAIDDMDTRGQEYRRKQFTQKIKSPLSIKVPLLDPERFLFRTAGYVTPLISWTGGAIWLSIVVLGILMLLPYWGELSSNLSDRILSVNNILLMALIYPVVKAIHELGHAYSVKKWGGEVHEIGIMLLLFFPVPYVDATAASAFSSKYQRMLVGAAGILVEGFLAALAAIVWVYVEPGLVRALAFNVMLVSGVSTVMFNGNPLLRFDAYYVLSDYLEIPNLQVRSNNYIGYLVKRYILGVKEITSPSCSGSESAWLATYALLSFAYRIFITVVITLFVATKYFIFGTIIGVWFVYLSIVLPIMKVFSKPLTDPVLVKIRKRVVLTTVSFIAAIFILLFLVPFPLSTQAEGVLSIDDQSYVRSEVRGFVSAIIHGSDELVSVDDALVRLENPELETQVNVLKYQVTESEERLQASIMDKSASEIIREELQFISREYRRAVERKDKLLVRSNRQGRLVLLEQSNLMGRYVNRGQALGYIVDDINLPVTVMVAEDNIDYVEHETTRVEVKYVSRPGNVYSARIRRIEPSSGNDLVSPVLSTEGGGRVPLDPNSKDNYKTFSRYYKVQIDILGEDYPGIEERVYVVFRHKSEPLYGRMYRGIKRVLLRHFNV